MLFLRRVQVGALVMTANFFWVCHCGSDDLDAAYYGIETSPPPRLGLVAT